jgi:hypothetical protein
MARSRQGQYGNLVTVIRLLGSDYDFSMGQYQLINGFYHEVDNVTVKNIRSLISNKNMKYFDPAKRISVIKQGILVYVRNILPVFENDLDPEHPEYKTKVLVSYNDNNFKLMGGMKIMDSVYMYTGQLESK